MATLSSILSDPKKGISFTEQVYCETLELVGFIKDVKEGAVFKVREVARVLENCATWIEKKKVKSGHRVFEHLFLKETVGFQNHGKGDATLKILRQNAKVFQKIADVLKEKVFAVKDWNKKADYKASYQRLQKFIKV